MKCEYCGRVYSAGETICSGCGAAIENPIPKSSTLEAGTDIEVNVAGVNIRINGVNSGQEKESNKLAEDYRDYTKQTKRSIYKEKRLERARILAEENQAKRKTRGLYAGFVRRALALWIDFFILALICGAFLGSILSVDSDMIVIACYFILCESLAGGATLGKRAMKIRVVNEEGNNISLIQSIIRYFGKMVSAMIFGIGFFIVVFSGQKQGLHDRIAKTYVIKD